MGSTMTRGDGHLGGEKSLTRRSFLLAGLMGAAGLAGCSSVPALPMAGGSDGTTSPTGGSAHGDGAAVTIDEAAWRYDRDNDIYYQIGVRYCANPAASEYESMAIYVPGAYFAATSNGNGTYTCHVDESATVGAYAASAAPVVIPVNTAGYSAQRAPSSYEPDGLAEYLEAGLVYVYAGCRGRNNGTNPDGTAFAGGAPWGVTDLKAAVRCLRYNAGSIPGGAKRVFTFGHSGGGAQSSLMGATGDSALYTPYLQAIGAVLTDDSGTSISDAITGSMCWCPITALDIANEAYEWMMGQFCASGTRAGGTWTALFSHDLARKFAGYINDLGITDVDGNTLTLQEGGEGIYTSGSYYDQVKSAIETSLNNFLQDTRFPYTPDSRSMADGGFAGGGGTEERTAGTDGVDGAVMHVASAATEDDSPSDGNEPVTYDTAEDYIASLNSDTEWIAYDPSSNTATITSVGEFVRHLKRTSKDAGAFDALDRNRAENFLFGNSHADALHFDPIMSGLLESERDKYASCDDYRSDYVSAYAGDMDNTDDLGTKSSVRQDMYNPMYFVAEGLDGYGSSTPAPHWRIRTGIQQGDTSLTTELNLALALRTNPAVKDVDFATVWEQAHTTAERTGSSTANFISWVRDCCS